MKHLLAILCLTLAACASSPVAVRVSTSGATELASDFDNVAVFARGAGYIMLHHPESGIPFWFAAFDEGTVYVAHLTEPKVSESFALGHALPLRVRPIVTAVYSQATLDEFGVVWEAEPTL
jgi:hypothetical protein